MIAILNIFMYQSDYGGIFQHKITYVYVTEVILQRLNCFIFNIVHTSSSYFISNTLFSAQIKLTRFYTFFDICPLSRKYAIEINAIKKILKKNSSKNRKATWICISMKVFSKYTKFNRAKSNWRNASRKFE